MRAKAYEESKHSLSYAVHEVCNGLLFFATNKLSRDLIPNPTDSCSKGVPVNISDKDIGAFGICKWKVNNTFICTNALDHIVTLDLDDTQFPESAASTFVASESCVSNCSVCSLMAEVCQIPAPNSLNYWYGSYPTVSFFVNLLLGLRID